ncbi:SDH family Clp fold serine proteinase [Candidatus Foliamicus sp.]
MTGNVNAQRTPRKSPATSDSIAVDWLHSKLTEVEKHTGMDAMTIFGPIFETVDHRVRQAIENVPNRRRKLLVIIDTPGGIVEVAERIVTTIRHYYGEVTFLIPDRAMSAGTVLVMSGDAILMDHFSCLGPVDPQLQIEGKPIPISVLSYLEQYERFVKKAEEGTLTSVDLVLLQKLDPADLRQYELAAKLSVQLIQDWLVKYKFKGWSEHGSTRESVTEKEKKDRAEDIAKALNDQERWGTHARGINRDVLAELKLKVDDLEADATLSELVKDYFGSSGTLRSR